MNAPHGADPVAAGARSRLLGAVVLTALILGCLAVFGYTLQRQRQHALEAALETAATHVRHFEENLTRTLQLVDLLMTSVEVPLHSGSSPAYGHAARTALRAAPYLRSLSVVDASGRVLASSVSQAQGLTLDIGDVFPAGEPAAEVLRLGRPHPGRDVQDLIARAPAEAARSTASGPLLVPVLRRLPPAPGATQPLWALAVLNPEHFELQAGLLLDIYPAEVHWLRLDGALLASTAVPNAPSRLATAQTIAQRLAERDFGRFEQGLADGRVLLTAYRASARYPAAVGVGVDQQQVLAAWWDDSRQLALVVLPAIVALAVAGGLALRWQAVGDRRQAEIQRQMQLSASVFESSSEAIALTTPDGRIMSCNRAFFEMTGYSATEIIGQTHRLLSSGQHDDTYYRDMWQSLQRDGRWHGEATNQRRDGSIFKALVSINAVRDERGQLLHYVGLMRDITERLRAEAAQREAERLREVQLAENRLLQELALRDPLTSLYNRRYLSETLPRELARVRRDQRSLAVVMVDIDRFKTINDTLGHAAGDVVIQALSRVLTATAREGDIACRYGGEEFVVIMPGMDTAAALERAERWRERTEQLRVHHDGAEMRFTLSAGVAAFPDHGSDAQSLLHLADQAMYRAKAGGRNQVCSASVLEDSAFQARL